MTSISYGATHEGRVRDHNEDTFADASITTARGEFHLVLVADGMGGHAQGEVASAMAAGAVREYIEYGAWREPARALHDAFVLANERVHATAGDMGTTLVAALIDERSGRYWVENVGDSRAYLVDAGALTPLTDDHSAIALRVAAGQLTREEASQAKGRNVLLRAIGPDAEVESDSFGPFVLRPGQRLLLCSDGLHSMVSEEAIARLAMAGALADVPKALIDAANAAGGEDNITAVVAAMPAADPTVLDLHGRPPRRRGRVGVSQLAPVAAAVAVLVASGAIGFGVFRGDGGNASNKAELKAPESPTGASAFGTATPVGAGSATQTRSATATPTSAPTSVPTAAATAAVSVAAPPPPPIATATPSPTPTPVTVTPNPSPTPSATPSPTPTQTPTPTVNPNLVIKWANSPFSVVELPLGTFNLTVNWESPYEWGVSIEAIIAGLPSQSCSAPASRLQCVIGGLPAGTYTVTLRIEGGGSSAASEQRSVTVPVKSE